MQEEKPEDLKKTCKQVWTGTQIHIWHENCELNLGLSVHSAGENGYATCFMLSVSPKQVALYQEN